MAGTLTFTLGIVTTPLVVGLRVAGTAFTGFTATARGMAGAASTAIRGITSTVRGTITALHQINGAVQAVQAGISGMLGPIKLAAQIETARVQFRVLMGDVKQADEIFGKLSKLADDNPILDLGPVAEAAKMLAGTNIDKTGIPEFLAQMGQAATSNESFLRMATAFSQILGNAGKASMEDLGQLRDAGLPTILTEMPRVLNVTSEEFSNMLSKGEVTFNDTSKALRNLTTGMGQYAGMAAAAAQTTEGKWSSVVTTLNQVQRAFGEKVNIALSPILDKAVEMSAKLIPLATAAGEKVRDIGFWLLAAFKSGRLGPILWDGFKLAGLSLLDLLGKGFMALGARLKEAFTEASLSLADKFTLALPSWLTDSANRKGAADRENARNNGTYPAQKSLAQHYEEADTGLGPRIAPLAASVIGNLGVVNPYSKALRETVEFEKDMAGNKAGGGKPGNVIKMVPSEESDSSGDKSSEPLLPAPSAKVDAQMVRRFGTVAMQMGRRGWQGPLDFDSSASSGGADGPGRGGMGGAGGGGGGGMGGPDDGVSYGGGGADPADPYGDKGRKSSPLQPRGEIPHQRL